MRRSLSLARGSVFATGFSIVIWCCAKCRIAAKDADNTDLPGRSQAIRFVPDKVASGARDNPVALILYILVRMATMPAPVAEF